MTMMRMIVVAEALKMMEKKKRVKMSRADSCADQCTHHGSVDGVVDDAVESIRILGCFTDGRATVDRRERVIGGAEQRGVRLADAAIDDGVQEHAESLGARSRREVQLRVVVLGCVRRIEDRQA